MYNWLRVYSVLHLAGQEDTLIKKDKEFVEGVTSVKELCLICHYVEVFEVLTGIHTPYHYKGCTCYEHCKSEYDNITQNV